MVLKLRPFTTSSPAIALVVQSAPPVRRIAGAFGESVMHFLAEIIGGMLLRLLVWLVLFPVAWALATPVILVAAAFAPPCLTGRHPANSMEASPAFGADGVSTCSSPLLHRRTAAPLGSRTVWAVSSRLLAPTWRFQRRSPDLVVARFEIVKLPGTLTSVVVGMALIGCASSGETTRANGRFAVGLICAPPRLCGGLFARPLSGRLVDRVQGRTLRSRPMPTPLRCFGIALDFVRRKTA